MWKALGWILEKLWRWDTVGVGSTLLFGFGVGAMYGNDYTIAGLLYIVSVGWLAAKLIAWEETTRHEHRNAIITFVVVLGLLVAGLSLLWIRHQATTHEREVAESKPKPLPQPPEKEVPKEVPNPDAANKTKPPRPTPPKKDQSEKSQTVSELDLSIILVKKEGFALWVKNNSDVTATDIYYWFGIVDLDQPNEKGVPKSLGLVGDKLSWLHKKDGVGPYSVIGSIRPPLPNGHRIFGFIGLNCFNCSNKKVYWVYQVIGVGGWYYEIPEKDKTDVNRLFEISYHLKSDPDYFVSKIPLSARQPIDD